MKVTFINLYSQETIARYLLSSYALKAYLNKFFTGENNVYINILNFSTKTPIPKICEEIIKDNPGCVGYSCYIWNIEKIFKVIENIKYKNKLKAIHVLGGPEISLSRINSLLDPTLGDYYAIGEGERKLFNLIYYLKAKNNNLDVEFPKGVAYWNNNKLNYVEDTNRIVNLDEIPPIYLSGVIEDRLYARQQAFLETQRGCRYKCKYCVYHKSLSSISYYSQQRIFDELDYLIVKKRISALRIFDAIFTSDLERAKKIVQHLLELKNMKGVRLPWIYWEFTYQKIDEEFIKLIASLKYCEKILNSDEIPILDRPQHYSDMVKNYTVINSVGVESFCGQALKAIGRAKIDRRKFDEFMNITRKYNIELKLDLILGLPFETFDSYFEGLEFFLPYFWNNDHILNIHRLQILPGSDLESLCENYRIKYSRKAPHLVFSTQSFPEEELTYASKLSAVLFRVVNSPLKRRFFEAKERIGGTFLQLLERIFNGITASQKLKEIQLIQNDCVDDIYWNDDIYREIPSQWLIDFLEGVEKG